MDWIDVIKGERDFYRYELSITYYLTWIVERERRKYWREGKCKNARTGEYILCNGPSDERILVRKLDKGELLFDADSGYLFEEKFQYGGYEGMHSKHLVYHFYKIKGPNRYHIRMMGTATNPEHAVFTEGESLFESPLVADVISSIEFH